MKHLVVALCTIFVTYHALGMPKQFKFEPSQGKISFVTKGWPSLIKISGEGSGVSGALVSKDGSVSGDLTFKLDSLKTGISLRDDHMKDNYLETKTFPTAVLTIKNLTVPEALSGDIEFPADLKLHGKTHSVDVTATLSKSGDSLTLSGKIPLKLSDFSIAIPSYKGITVAETVNIAFESKVMN